MSNINSVVKGLSLDPGSWYYWFYPHNGAFLKFPDEIEGNRTVMVFAARPNSSGHAFLESGNTVVHTELSPPSQPGRRRHVYRFLVTNHDTQFARAFSIAASELRA